MVFLEWISFTADLNNRLAERVMAKDLTNGFDIAAQVSEEVSQDIFRMSYWTGGIPDYISKTGSQNSSEITEVYFDQPNLQFVKIGDLPNAVTINLRFTTRVFPETIEIPGDVKITMTAIIKVQQDGSSVIVVDFANVPDQFDFKFFWMPENTQILESRVKPLITNTLFQKLKILPISPPVSSDVGFFTFQVYVLSNESVPNTKQNRFISIYVNKENNQLNPPGTVNPMLYKDPYESWKPKDALRIAIPREIVMPLIDQKLQEMGFKNLPKTSPTDSTVTINSLSMDLQNGHIKVTGNATKEIDVLPDPDIDFDVRIGLWIENGILQTNVLYVDADLPWWAESLHFLLPFIGTIILSCVESAMKDAVGKSIGGISQGALSDIAIFSSDLPGTGGIVKVTNTGGVIIQHKGLILPGQVTTVFNKKEVKKPFYIFGHKDSKEFHKTECPYHAKMKWQNKVPFINAYEALMKSYNGCAWCYPEYDVSKPGGVEFKVRAVSSNPADMTNFLTTIQGECLSVITIGNLKVKPSFKFFRNLEMYSPNNDDIYTSKSYGWYELIPSKWKFTVKTDDWNAECIVDVPNKDSKGMTYITATKGKTTCNHAFGVSPDFP